ncbi:amidase [Salinisphaera sp. PC39]|uniref:amidase n=1 Tax=Salinisphaera sp. PC39 TaxID=1304156 RepID=UPI003341CBAC
MRFEEYRARDGLGLAALIAAGEVTATEVLETAVARAESVNPTLNAIIHRLHDEARARAAEPLTGPFAGVPFLVKDLFQDIAGAPAHYGCRGLKEAGYRAERTSEIVRRHLDAGTLILGRTNTPEFGAKGITEPEAYGAARNPWDTGRTPGGSSGGSAAAVAAGIVPLAGANDGGGSIRIPAACCGLFGLKPGRGRTPLGPDMGEIMHGAAVNHVVSRSVRDSAAMLDATHGPERGAGYHPAPPEESYLSAAGRDPRPLRIGFTTRSPVGTEVSPEARAAVEDAARLLADLGHHVDEAEPAIDGLQLAKDWMQMWFAQMAASVDRVKSLTGCGNDGFELDTRAMAALGRAARADEYVAGYNRWHEYNMGMADFHDRHDLFLTPTLALPPARVGEIVTPAWQRAALRVLLPLGRGVSRLLLKSGVVDQMVHENLRYVPFTQLANLTGAPAMSVPLHWTADDLPLGVQFVAPVGGEELLFSLAGQLERARPWFDRVPAG